MFHNKIDKCIYCFLKDFYKTNNFHNALNTVKSKLSCNNEYAYFIVSECIKFNYLDGISVTSTMNNSKNIAINENSRVNRNGLQFMDKYKSDIFNFFFIPFKTILIITLTTLITVLITNYFSN